MATRTASAPTLEAPQDPTPPGLKIPKTLAACADLLFTKRAERLAADKAAEALKAHETFLTNYIIDNLPKSQAEGIVGKLCSVTITRKIKPTVEDWDIFYKYVKRTGAFELLQRRLGEKAVQERWDAGKVIPGVGSFPHLGLSITKRS